MLNGLSGKRSPRAVQVGPDMEVSSVSMTETEKSVQKNISEDSSDIYASVSNNEQKSYNVFEKQKIPDISARTLSAAGPDVSDMSEEEKSFFNGRLSKDGFWNFLIIGTDARDGESLDSGNYSADAILICSVDPSGKEVRLASLSRKLLLLKYGTEEEYASLQDMAGVNRGGSPQQLMSTVNFNFDLDIRDMVIINWAAAAQTVNMLGGVYLDIPQEEIEKGMITGLLTEVVYETGIGTDGQFEKGGLTWCDGPKAVAYCRNRFIAGGDRGRLNRITEVFSLLAEQVKQVSVTELLSLIKIVFTNVSTTLSIEELLDLAACLPGYSVSKTAVFPENYTLLPMAGGVADPCIPENLADEVKKLHAFLYDEEHDPSGQVRTISDNLAYLKQISEPGSE